MANGIRTGDSRGFNKGRTSKLHEGSQIRQTPEEGRRSYWLKRCGNNNKDDDSSPKTLNDKNHQASSEKFRQLNLKSLRSSFSFFLFFFFFFFSSISVTHIKYKCCLLNCHSSCHVYLHIYNKQFVMHQIPLIFSVSPFNLILSRRLVTKYCP